MCHLLLKIIYYVYPQVHYMRSVKRVAERVNKGSKSGYQAFVSIGYAIPHIKNKEDVTKLFKVLCGKEPISTAEQILGSCSAVTSYKENHNSETWSLCSHWNEWWTRPVHLSK